MNAQDYGITVRRVIEEGEPCFEARVRELPDVVEYADTFEEAYELAIDTIETTAEALAEQGRAMPGPQPPADDFSGRITLRVPKTLHRALAHLAEDEGVSLNQHIVTVLSYYVGVQAPSRKGAVWRASSSPEEIEAAGHSEARIVHEIPSSGTSGTAGWAAEAV